MIKKSKITVKKNAKKQQQKQKPVKRQQSFDEPANTDKDFDASNDSDSMIENDITDGSAEETVNEIENNDESDDGFSENEAEDETKQNNLVAGINKRKTDATNEDSVTTTPKNKKPKIEKVKPPTLEEINQLKETRNLFHSNLFRLQVKEMIEQIKIKEKYMKFINNWLELLKEFLKKITSAETKEDAANLEWLSKCNIKLPLNLQQLGVQTHKQKSYQFQFIKPSQEPYLIGATATQTLLGPKIIADICIPIPAACFQKENYLNMVYEQKRALYLTYIAWQIMEHNVFEQVKIENMKFNYYANNPLKPILEITPSANMGSIANKLIVRLFVAAEEKTFKLNRFVPWNSNVRAMLFDNVDENEVLQTATPNYNANVLFDLTMQRNQQLINEVFQNQKNFQEGLLLLKVWLRQRQLNVGFSGFSSYILSLFIVYLYKQRKMHANMSSYQVARTVWINMAHSCWEQENKGITLYPSGYDQANQPTLEQFHVHYPVVFVDVTGFYNICSNLSLDIYMRVRNECKLAVDLLNDMKLNSFQLIFMVKHPIYTQVDHILKLNKTDAVDQILEMHVEPADKYNYFGFGYPQILKVVTKLLSKGLGKRVHALLPIEQLTESWSVQQTPSNASKHLHLGIILNSEHAFEVLDKGPESIAENAESFRRFWGSKAELRRFQDGTITESVVWATSKDSLMQKRLVVRSIILHLLQHHFQLESTDIDYVADNFDSLYKLTPIYKIDRMKSLKSTQNIDAAEQSLWVIRAFDDLARKLHNLTELPLEIITIASYSPVFRGCEPEPILPQARIINDQLFSNHVQHGIIQLGISGKWPNELGALRALKVAFYIQIAQLLREKHRLATKVTYDGLLVIKDGYCFAVELAHPKEVSLLKKEVSERGITQYVDCPASIALEKRQYILPKITGALHALNQQYPSFGATVIIAKRWLYTQLIDDGLWPDECTELLIASMYLKAHADQITNTPQVGFIRFLHLLANTNWMTELFFLNFNNSVDENEISTLEQRFNEQRDSFPLLCIATAYDQKHYGTIWSSNDRPNGHVLSRVSRLAKQAIDIIEKSILSTDEAFINPSVLFKASPDGYNVVIQLKPDAVPTALVRDYGSPFAAFSKPNWRLQLAGTNFIKEAVQKLREGYSDYAAFFYNPCGGKEIGVIWKPASVFEEKPFKVADINGCSISPADPTKVQCCKETLLEDFKFILKDFYRFIDTVDVVKRESLLSLKHSKSERFFNKIALPTNDGARELFNNDAAITTPQKSFTNKSNKVKNVETKLMQTGKKWTQLDESTKASCPKKPIIPINNNSNKMKKLEVKDDTAEDLLNLPVLKSAEISKIKKNSKKFKAVETKLVKSSKKWTKLAELTNDNDAVENSIKATARKNNSNKLQNVETKLMQSAKKLAKTKKINGKIVKNVRKKNICN